MKAMRLWLLATLLILTGAANAQKITVSDTDGNPVPYASVMTQDAQFVGITDLNGVLADAKGHKHISITHVAYKTKEVDVTTLANGRVTLEDSDFGLEEITVSPKPFVYVQTYYRCIFYDETDGVKYYRAGLTDNVIDRQKKENKTKTRHISKAFIGIVKTLLNMLAGSAIDGQSELRTNKFEKILIEGGKSINLAIVEESPGKKIIKDTFGIVGQIIDDKEAGQRHFAYDSHLIYKHKVQVAGNEKKIKKLEARDEKKKNRKDADFSIYHIDDDGNYLPEDFVMMQYLTDYDEVQKDGSLLHNFMIVQVFTIERAYVTKEEAKQMKKDNKLEKSYEAIQKFERENKIPDLPEAVQKKLNELWKVDND